MAAHRAHDFDDMLKDRFPSNGLMAGSGNPWWPDHALGAGCARWAHASAEALADFLVDETNVNPNHKAHKTAWFSE
ncbi:MAG: hypothetical protein QNM02_16205 [Acidimicrobiia bacterium]|nr:hypothetical protein [Acidimicrobiia bacterium]